MFGLLPYSNCLFAESFVVNASGGRHCVCVATVNATLDEITEGSLVLDMIWDAKNTCQYKPRCTALNDNSNIIERDFLSTMETSTIF